MCTQPSSCYVSAPLRAHLLLHSLPAFYLLTPPFAACVFRAPLSVCLFRCLNVCANILPCKDINPNCAWHLSAPTTTSTSTTTTTCRSSLLVLSFCFAFVSLLLLLLLFLLLLLYLVAFLSVSLSAIIRRTKSANILSDTQICKYAAHTHIHRQTCVCVCVCVVLLKLLSSQRHRQLSKQQEALPAQHTLRPQKSIDRLHKRARWVNRVRILLMKVPN